MSTRNVVVTLQGGIGNLLFQYTAGRTMAEMTNADLWFSEAQLGVAARLEAYLGISIALAEPWACVRSGFPTLGNATAHRLIAAALRASARFGPLILDEDHAAIPQLPTVPSWIRLHGYHQHPTFFEPNMTHVLNRLHTSMCPDVATEMAGTFIHLRRGDYVRLGWALEEGYYILALKRLHDLDQLDGEIHIMSDDVFLSSAFASWLRERGYSVHAGAATESRVSAKSDFGQLSRARNVVLSNSSFAWWATALGDHLAGDSADRAVIYPAGWTGLPGADVLRRPSWHVVGG